MAKRKALLIGINRYRIPGADRRGCVNDVTNMEAALVEFCRFSSERYDPVPQLEGRKARLGARFLSPET